MDPSCRQFLSENPELIQFVRYHPVWYRYLARDGLTCTAELQNEADKFYGKTFPQRLEKINNQVQMIHMLMQFSEALKD